LVSASIAALTMPSDDDLVISATAVDELADIDAGFILRHHKITFDANVSIFDGSMTDLDIHYSQTKALTRNGFTRVGYDFAGWSTGRTGTLEYPDGTNYKLEVDDDVPLYALWNAKGDTAYKVAHYLVDDNSTTLKETTNHKAATEESVNAIPRSYTGYALNAVHPQAVASGVVVGDGSLVLKLYYSVNRHSVTYQVTGNLPTGAPSAPAATNNVAFGTNVTVSANLSYIGYTFSGWSSSQVSGASFIMPDEDVVFTAQWKQDTTLLPVTPPVDPLVTPPVNPLRPPVVQPVDPPEEPPTPPTPPAPPEEEVIPEPAEPEAPTDTSITVTSFEGFSEGDAVKLEAQSGNLFRDLANGNVPLGNFYGKGAWSLISLILSLIAIIISVLLAIGSAARHSERRALEQYGETEEAKEKRKRTGVLKALTMIAGVLTLVVWLILDDLTLPMVWLNNWTIFVGIVFIVHLIFFTIYKARNGKEEDDNNEEDNSGSMTA
jgi:uncharacterized repeat protein (TIGR02543 family)